MDKPKFVRKVRVPKPSVINMVKELYDEFIPALESPAEAEKVEADLYRSMQGGLLTQTEYLGYRSRIRKVYEKNDWALPIE